MKRLLKFLMVEPAPLIDKSKFKKQIKVTEIDIPVKEINDFIKTFGKLALP